MYVHTYINICSHNQNVSSIPFKGETNVVECVSLTEKFIRLRKNKIVGFGDTWIGCHYSLCYSLAVGYWAV